MPTVDAITTIEAIRTNENSGIKGVGKVEELGEVWVGVEFGEFVDCDGTDGEFVG
jgi:hypothetical protein